MGAISPVGGGRGKKVLVLGATGGVGTLAVQMLVAEGVEVYATCSTDAVEMVQHLGVDYVLDYNDPAHVQQLASVGRLVKSIQFLFRDDIPSRPTTVGIEITNEGKINHRYSNSQYLYSISSQAPQELCL